MRRRRGRRKVGRWLLAGVGAVLFVLLFLCGPSGLFRIIRLRQEEQRLISEATSLMVQIEMALQRKERLLSDSEYLRRVAEERLGLGAKRDSL